MSVVIETTLGDITVDLYLEQRPVTCLNFLKLCKMKYYNFNLFHSIRSGFIAQTGDPTAEGSGGESIFGLLEGPGKRFFNGEKLPKIRHTNTGTLSMVCTDDMMVGSQFFFTLAPDLDSLDGIHCVIGEVTEGHDVLRMLNDVICDENHRPYRDVRITHTVILEDPFNDPPGLNAPSRSPSPSAERLKGGRIAPDEDIDEAQGKSAQEIQEMIEEKEAKARATILEIVGDLPDADIAPPENVLFVCKLNPVTTDEDLEIIFSRFGKIIGCEVIRDKKTGDSLQYAFIEFDDKKSCEDAYFKMDNVLIDDRRIHVDFSQSVSRMRWMGKGKGIKYFNNNESKESDKKEKEKDREQDNSKIEDSHRKRERSRDRDRHDRKDRDDKHERSHRHNRDSHRKSDRDRSRRDKSRSKHKSSRDRSRSRHKSSRDRSRSRRKSSRDRSRSRHRSSRDRESRRRKSESSRSRRSDHDSRSERNDRHRSRRDRSRSRHHKDKTDRREKSPAKHEKSREREKSESSTKKNTNEDILLTSQKDRDNSIPQQDISSHDRSQDNHADQVKRDIGITLLMHSEKKKPPPEPLEKKEIYKSSYATYWVKSDILIPPDHSESHVIQKINSDHEKLPDNTSNEHGKYRNNSTSSLNISDQNHIQLKSLGNQQKDISTTMDTSDGKTNQNESLEKAENTYHLEKNMQNKTSQKKHSVRTSRWENLDSENIHNVPKELPKTNESFSKSRWDSPEYENLQDKQLKKKEEDSTQRQASNISESKHKESEKETNIEKVEFTANNWAPVPSIDSTNNEKKINSSKTKTIKHKEGSPRQESEERYSHHDSTDKNHKSQETKKCESIEKSQNNENEKVNIEEKTDNKKSDTNKGTTLNNENNKDKDKTTKEHNKSEDNKKSSKEKQLVNNQEADNETNKKKKPKDHKANKKSKEKPHKSPTPIKSKKLKGSKKSESKKKNTKHGKKKRKYSTSSESSSEKSSSSESSSSSEDEKKKKKKKKKTVKSRKRRVSTSSSSSTSTTSSSSSSSSESTSSSSSDSEPTKKKRKKVTSSKVNKRKKNKKK